MKNKRQRSLYYQLNELEEKLASIRANAKQLEDDYTNIRKEHEKKHKKLISIKEKYRQICDKIINNTKDHSAEDAIKENGEKEQLIVQLSKKEEELEKYKAKKRKQYEKEYDQANKVIADAESKIEQARKVLILSEH